MGCISSKTDINDLHPNVFQVINVDEAGNRLSSGQLEITESHLIFYQRKKEPIKWPLRSLRRYGFDAELFSFESGRRCPTGAGIYAFRCQRAEQLFNLLQAKILMRNNAGEDTVSREFPVASNPGPIFPTRINVPSSDGNYLDPAPVRRGSRTGQPTSIRFVSQSSGVSTRLSSVGSSSNGPISPQGTASPSPPPVPIPIPIPHPLPPTPVSNSASATYVNEELFSSVTDNFAIPSFLESSNKKLAARPPFHINGTTPIKLSPAVECDSRMPHLLPNTVSSCEISTPVTTTHSDVVTHTQSNSSGSYVNIDVSNVPSLLAGSVTEDTNYAQLDLSDAQQGHLYMNVIPGTDILKATEANNGSSWNKPTFPNCIISMQQNEIDVDEPRHCYANLEPGNIEVPLSLLPKVPVQPLNQIPALDKVPSAQNHQPHSITPALGQFRQVNYIVLDLEQNKDSSVSSALQQQQTSPSSSTSPAAGSVSTESPHRGSEGYATIDFNKTVALSHSVNPSLDNDSESSRKTRHNSTISDLVSAPAINSPTE